MKVHLPDELGRYEIKTYGIFTTREWIHLLLAASVAVVFVVPSLLWIHVAALRWIVIGIGLLLAGSVTFIGMTDLFGLSLPEYVKRSVQQVYGNRDKRPVQSTGSDRAPEPTFTPAPRRGLFRRKNQKPKPLRYVANNAQDTIPFQRLYENGLLLLTPKTAAAEKRYALVFSIENANYQLQRESVKETKAQVYADIVAQLPPDIHYQELFLTVPVDVEKLRSAILPSGQPGAESTEVLDCYVQNQSHYIDSVASTISDCRLYGVLSYVPQNELEDPYRVLNDAFLTVQSGLIELGSNATAFRPEDTLQLLFQCLHPFQREEFQLPESFFDKGLRLKDCLIQEDIRFTYPEIQIGDTRMRVYYATSFSNTLDDSFVSSLLATPARVAVVKHIDHISTDDAEERVNDRLVKLETDAQGKKSKNARLGTDYLPYSLEKEIKACRATLDELGGTQQLFDLGLYVVTYARDEEERQALDTFVRSIAARHQVRIAPIQLRQEEAFGTILPLGCDRLDYKKQHISRALSVLHPFTYKRQFAPHGYFYGFNTTAHSPIIHDRKSDLNGHAFYLGQTGCGKSLLAKLEILDTRMLCPEDYIFSIDPDNEMNGVAQLVGGQIIDVAPGSNTYINPFDIYDTPQNAENAVRGKTGLILALMEAWKTEPLTAKERSLLDRSVIQVYKPYLQSARRPQDVPTMKDFAEVLRNQPEQEAKDLCLYLEMYVFGSVDMFAHRTNIAAGNHFLNFQLRGLDDHLQISGMLFLLDFIRQRTHRNFQSGQWSWMYADEFQRYYRTAASGEFFNSIFAEYRKFGGLATGLTQNITDLNDYPAGRAMLANSNMVVLMANSQRNVELAQELYDLSPDQAKRLRVDKRGCGLFITGADVTPFEHLYPDDNLIYKAITTKFQDHQEALQQHLKEQKTNCT